MIYILAYDTNYGDREEWNTFYTPLEAFTTDAAREARISFLTNTNKELGFQKFDLDINDETNVSFPSEFADRDEQNEKNRIANENKVEGEINPEVAAGIEYLMKVLQPVKTPCWHRQFYKVEENEDGTCILHATDCGYINGYSFGDTMLEDVLFKITVNPDYTLKAEVHANDASYFSNLNQTRWLNAAVEYAETVDIFYDETGNTGNPCEDIVLYDHSKPFSEQEASFTSEPIFKE